MITFVSRSDYICIALAWAGLLPLGITAVFPLLPLFVPLRVGLLRLGWVLLVVSRAALWAAFPVDGLELLLVGKFISPPTRPRPPPASPYMCALGSMGNHSSGIFAAICWG